MQETVNESEAKPIYIGFELTTPKYISIRKFFDKYDKEGINNEANQFLWNCIREITMSNITHAFMSLDPSLTETISYTTYTDGVVIEDVPNENIDNPNMILIVFTGFISNKSYEEVEDFIKYQHYNAGKSKYNMSEIKNRLFRVRKKKVEKKDLKTMCSSFVNAVLNYANVKNAIPVSKSPSPGSVKNFLLNNNNFECVFVGPSSAFDAEKIVKRTNEFAKQNYVNIADDTNTSELISIQPLFKNNPNNSLRNYILFQDNIL